MRKFDRHSIERTSPKGPGQKFVGYCIRCGKQDLTSDDFLKDPCLGGANMSEKEALLEMLGVPPDHKVN